MTIEVIVEDTELDGFSLPAKQALQKAGADFIRRIITESNRIESAQNTEAGSVEITKSIVDKAVLLQMHTFAPKKSGWGIKTVRTGSALLSMFAGFMFDTEKIQDPTYLILFIIVMAAAVVCITISALKE